jgi:hypothetical protein
MKRLVPFDLTHDPQSRRSHGTMLIDQDGPFVLYEDAMAAVLAEREDCAKICESIGWSGEGMYFAQKIRARGEKA